MKIDKCCWPVPLVTVLVCALLLGAAHLSPTAAAADNVVDDDDDDDFNPITL